MWVQGLSPDSPLLGSVGIGWMLLAINDVDVARMDREAVLCALTRCGGAVRRLVLNPEPRRRLPWHARLSPGRSPRFELAARAERLATQWLVAERAAQLPWIRSCTVGQPNVRGTSSEWPSAAPMRHLPELI